MHHPNLPTENGGTGPPFFLIPGIRPMEIIAGLFEEIPTDGILDASKWTVVIGLIIHDFFHILYFIPIHSF